MCLQNSTARTRRLLHKPPPKTQTMRLHQECSPEFSLRKIFRETAGQLKRFTTNLVPHLLRRGDIRLHNQIQGKGRLDKKLNIDSHSSETPAASVEELQHPLKAVATANKSDTWSSNDGSTTSMGCSQISTIATEANSKTRSSPDRSHG